MTPDQHPGLEELMLYCLGSPSAAADDPVRLHLKECAHCNAQMALLRGDMALAAMAVPQIAPPAGAKERLFQTAGLDLAQATKTAKLQGKTGNAEATAVSSVAATGNVIPMKPRRVSPGLMWGGWVAAAACLFFAMHLRQANQGMRQQLQTETAEIVQSNNSAARAQKVLDVLSSPQAQRVTLVAAHAKPEPAGHAVYLADRGALVFTASNLAPLPANKTYELWVIPANGTAPIPAGTFQPDARGMASVLLPKLPQGVAAKAFGVTLENAGGASTPTMPILLAGG